MATTAPIAMSPTAAIFDVFETFGSLRKSIPFSIRTDPLLLVILSIVKKLFGLFASFLLYARRSARTFKNPSGMMQNYVVLLLNSGINKKILKVAIKINKMNQRGLDNGGGEYLHLRVILN